MKIYILDSNNALCPIGVKGELCVSGVGVGRGYLNDPQKTAQSFVMDPFREGERMYRTGDTARFRRDGVLEFYGRNDHQVKIRGYRIELGEIENQLGQLAGVNQAVVLVKEDDTDNKYLVAYLVGNETIDSAQIQEELKQKLPDYMVPRVFVALDQIPLTNNGKVDRKKLLKKEIELEEIYVAPETDTQIHLTRIWGDVLDIDEKKISISNDFFEMGGNSLVAFQVILEVKKRLDKQLVLRDIFEHTTIRTLASILEDKSISKDNSFPKVAHKKYNLTSSAQERMFYQYLMNKQGLGYNISGGIVIKGNFDQQALLDALQVIVDRHPALRTNFVHNEQGLYQYVNPKVTVSLEVFDQQIDDVNIAYHQFRRPHDLEKQNSLIRFGLFPINDSKNILFLDMHHIICDGFSTRIILNEVKNILMGEPLLPLTHDYIDYSYWQRNENSWLQNQRNYWLEKLSGDLPVINLPMIEDREGIDMTNVGLLSSYISEENYVNIKEMIREHEVTEFMFFISIYYLLLQKVIGKEDVIIGTDVVGRTHTATKNIVGTFVNILPLRMDVAQEYSFIEFMQHVKDCVLEAYDHQDFQFDDMVKLVGLSENTGISPIVQVHFAFNYYESDMDGFRINDVTYSPIQLSQDTTTQYEFKIEALDTGDQYKIDFIYAEALYELTSMEVFRDYYASIIHNVLQNEGIKLSEIDLTPVQTLS